MRGSRDEASKSFPETNVTRAWREAMTLFSNARGMQIKPNWLTGIADRMSSDRVARLENTKAAHRLGIILAQLDDAEMRQFRARAEVNLDQAIGAMRLTLVVNFSTPIGFILIANQIFPGRLGEAMQLLDPPYLFIFFAAFVVTLVLFVWYCYAGVAQARDVRHLCMLESAKRARAEHAGSATEEFYPETDVSEAL